MKRASKSSKEADAHLWSPPVWGCSKIPRNRQQPQLDLNASEKTPENRDRQGNDVYLRGNAVMQQEGGKKRYQKRQSLRVLIMVEQEIGQGRRDI